MKKILCLLMILIFCAALTATLFAGNTVGNSSSGMTVVMTTANGEPDIFWFDTTAPLSDTEGPALHNTAAKPENTVVAYSSGPVSTAGTAGNPKIIDFPGNSVPEEAVRDQAAQMDMWQNLGYLDYIADYYWYIPGYNPQDPKPIITTYVIYATESTNDEIKEKIVATLPEDVLVEWKTCRYSWNELTKLSASLIHDFPNEIAYIQRETDATSVYLGVYFKKSLDSTAFDDAVSAVKEKYYYPMAMNIYVEPDELYDGGLTGDGPLAETWLATAPLSFDSKFAPEEGNSARPFILLGASLLVLLLTGGLFLVLRRNRAAVLTSGETVSASVPSKKEVEEAVSKSGEEPSDSVYDDLMKKL